uniref:Uncharacterized protein n=1 Tax=Stomoxys calcitrans TaxID=35570 RepID=A0A1I8PSX2_STOCA
MDIKRKSVREIRRWDSQLKKHLSEHEASIHDFFELNSIHDIIYNETNPKIMMQHIDLLIKTDTIEEFLLGISKKIAEIQIKLIDSSKKIKNRKELSILMEVLRQYTVFDKAAAERIDVANIRFSKIVEKAFSKTLNEAFLKFPMKFICKKSH